MRGPEYDIEKLNRRIRAADYLTVAQLFLQSNFLLDHPLSADDIKPRLLGHWGTCPGINIVYANLKAHFETLGQPLKGNFQFILGPGHGFPALQANLFLDHDLEQVDEKVTHDSAGIEYICKNFSWPDGFPSHASPFTPGVISEGGELGYAFGRAYGAALGHPEKTVAVLIGDGEFETATSLASLNLPHLMDPKANGKVIPILHLNGYKISGPTVAARKSERELNEVLRGFGYTPLAVKSTDHESFQATLEKCHSLDHPFIVFRSIKGLTGPATFKNQRISDNYLSHQIPLPAAKSDPASLKLLESWLESYHIRELFNNVQGFLI